MIAASEVTRVRGDQDGRQRDEPGIATGRAFRSGMAIDCSHRTPPVRIRRSMGHALIRRRRVRMLPPPRPGTPPIERRRLIAPPPAGRLAVRAARGMRSTRARAIAGSREPATGIRASLPASSDRSLGASGEGPAARWPPEITGVSTAATLAAAGRGIEGPRIDRVTRAVVIPAGIRPSTRTSGGPEPDFRRGCRRTTSTKE